MIRGTTPTLKFVLPFITDGITGGYITIAQHNGTVIDLPVSRCTIGEKSLTVTLTQAETLLLKPARAEIQLRLKFGDLVTASRIIDANVGRILKEGVI